MSSTASRSHASARKARRALPPAVAVVLGMLAVLNVLGALAFIPDRGGDFAMIYQSTVAWLHGLPPYDSPGTPTTNLNHPLVWLLVLPFTAVPQPAAFILWNVLSLAAFAAVAAVAARAAEARSLDVGLLVLASTGASFELALGQIAFALMLPLAGAWWFDRTKRDVAAGLCVGLLCVLKPFFGLIAVMFLWRRQWRALAGVAVAGALALLAGWLLAGTDGYLAWIRNLRHVTWTWHVFNGSVWGVGSRLFTAQQLPIATTWTPLAISPLAANALAAVGVAAVLLVLWRTLRRAVDVDTRYALVTLACLLLSPLGWVYYLPACFAPIVVTLARRPTPALWVVCALAVCPYPVLVNRNYGWLGTLTLGQISFVVTCGLFVLVAAAARHSPAPARVYTTQPDPAS